MNSFHKPVTEYEGPVSCVSFNLSQKIWRSFPLIPSSAERESSQPRLLSQVLTLSRDSF